MTGVVKTRHISCLKGDGPRFCRGREAQTGPRVTRGDKARHLYLWGDGQQRQVTFVHVTISHFLRSVKT